MKHVAELAGVSMMTVSRAVTRPDRVGAETLARVREALAATGYVPNMAASALRRAESRLIAAVVPSLRSHLFDRVLSALGESLAEQGYQLLFGQADYSSQREDDLLRAIIGRRPDGILVLGSVKSEATRRLLRSSGIPVVEAGDVPAQPIDMAVGLSHEKLAKAVCRYLAGKGHRRLAFFSGDDERAQRRVKSFKAEAKRLGLPEVHVLLGPSPTDHALGRKLMRELHASRAKVDAVHCSSDLLAAGVLTECRHLDIAIPRTLAVIGTGDVDFAESLYPSLTTVRVDGALMGRTAARLLMDRLAGQTEPVRPVTIGFEIVERESA